MRRNLSRLSWLSRRKTETILVTDLQRTFLKREPLVTEADLNKMQRAWATC